MSYKVEAYPQFSPMFPLKPATCSHAGIDGNCDWVRAQGRCDRYGTIDLQAWLSLGQPVRLVEQKSFPAFFHRTSGSDESLGGRSKEGVCSTDMEVRLEACLDKRRRSERKGAPWYVPNGLCVYYSCLQPSAGGKAAAKVVNAKLHA